MNKFTPKTYPGAINAESKPSFRLSETLRAAVSVSNKKGFTLIELLVVVLIIGILSAVALPQYQGAVDKVRFSKAQALVGTILAAQKVYYMANGQYASKWEDLDITVGTPRGGKYTDVSQDIYCYIGGTNNEYGGCAYSMSNGGRILNLVWWNSGSQNCYAPVGDERANKVCKSVTGKTTPTLVGSDNVYVF